MKKDLIQYTKELFLRRYPVFASELSKANLEYRTNLKYKTAATDGKNIYFDPDYLESLSDDEKVFVLAHELMHIKFNHARRMTDKNGIKRDPDIWNYVCDAIINANLECDGFKIKDGYVNSPEAIMYAAEELYDKLIKEKQTNPDFKLNLPGDGGEGSPIIGDDHTLWEESSEEKLKEESEQNTPDKGLTKPQMEVNEKEVFSKAREEKNIVPSDKLGTPPKGNDSKPAEGEEKEDDENCKSNNNEALERLKKLREQMLKKTQEGSSDSVNLGDVGIAKEYFDWRLLLRREIERSGYVWSQRRSIAENNFAYRLVENEVKDEAVTEVMIDVSGSVSLDLVKGFLRMLKPLLKESKLKVGCFNEKFWGMIEIKTTTDIDNFIIPEGARGHSRWTEDWDLAVRSFTKKKKINKIVFTDGKPEPGTMPKSDLKNENVIWLVYGNKNFKPCCGKVIQINTNQLRQMQNLSIDNNVNKRRR